MRLFIISNRLPVKVTDKNGVRTFTRSEGGVATGLNSLRIDCERHWIGWPGICTEVEEERREIHSKLKDMNFHPVFLSHAHIENYYEGYSEDINFETKEQLGNFPQAYSHLALVNTAILFSEEEKRLSFMRP